MSARFHRMGNDSCSKPPWMAATSWSLRDMASTALVVLSGTEGGFGPFWSSDSRSVAFFSLNGRLHSSNESLRREGPYG